MTERDLSQEEQLMIRRPSYQLEVKCRSGQENTRRLEE